MKLSFEIDVNDKNNIHQVIDVLLRLMSTVPVPKYIEDLIPDDLRAIRVLKAENINTVEQLFVKSYQELLMLPNMGRKSLNNINEKLSQFGCTLIGTKS